MSIQSFPQVAGVTQPVSAATSCRRGSAIQHRTCGSATPGVSTRDQHPEAQHDALSAAGCEQIYVDQASGRLARRPELDAAPRAARAGDQLVVTKLDRLGRSLAHLIELATLQQRQLDLVVLDQGVDTSTAVGRTFFSILGAIAEFEASLLSERTKDGLEAARARGRTGGQKPRVWPTGPPESG